MTRFLLFLAIIGLYGAYYANAYPRGAPPVVCNDMEPRGHKKRGPNEFLKRQSSKVYSIKSGCYVIYPGDEMDMWIAAEKEIETYRGLLMRVVDEDGNPAGSFRVRPNSPYKTLDCGKVSDSAVTHSDRSDKDTGSKDIRWTAPITCKQNSYYKIRATVVYKFQSWQTDLEIDMICRPDFRNKTAMLLARPPSPTDYCAAISGGRGKWAILPRATDTSFEVPLPPNGWKHLYLRPDIKLVRYNKASPTLFSGPTAAHDGEWYMYYPANKSMETDMAGLYSPYGIQGCVCFSFWCHMKTDGTARFKVTAVGTTTRTLVDTTARTDYWRQVRITMVSDAMVMLIVQVFRGQSIFGEVGLDDLKITAGACTREGEIATTEYITANLF